MASGELRGTVPAIVPAAGASSRMGRPKLTLAWGAATVLEATIAALRGGGAGPVIVVLGAGRPEAEELVAATTRAGARFVWNPEPDGPMLLSVQVGLAAAVSLAAEAAPGAPDASLRGVLVTPGDLPALRPGTVAAVIAALQAGAAIAVPRHGERHGHPLGIGAALLPEVGTLDPAVGLRELRRRHAESTVEIAVVDPGAVADLDTPEEYAAIRRRLDRDAAPD